MDPSRRPGLDLHGEAHAGKRDVAQPSHVPHNVGAVYRAMLPRLAVAPFLLLALACTTTRSTGGAPTIPEQGTFILREGTTALVTERFQRSAGALEADLMTPIGVRVAYAARLRPDASVSFIDVRQYAPNATTGDPPMQQSTGTFEGDTVLLSLNRGEATTQAARRATVPGVVPYINPSPSLMEQVVRRARALRGRRVDVPVWLSSNGGQNVTATVEFTTPDSARLELAGTSILLRLDPEGRLLSGAIPAQGLILERTASAPSGPGPRSSLSSIAGSDERRLATAPGLSAVRLLRMALSEGASPAQSRPRRSAQYRGQPGASE